MTERVITVGRQYDKDGNLRQWWNNGTIKAFRQRAQCIIDQYSDYVLEQIGMNVSDTEICVTQTTEVSKWVSMTVWV